MHNVLRGLTLAIVVSASLLPHLAAADVLPVGSEFQVNTYTTSGQSGPAMATDADGDFVVVWRSENQDGSSYGVFGRRFAGPEPGPTTPAPMLSKSGLIVTFALLLATGLVGLRYRRRAR